MARKARAGLIQVRAKVRSLRQCQAESGSVLCTRAARSRPSVYATTQLVSIFTSAQFLHRKVALVGVNTQLSATRPLLTRGAAVTQAGELRRCLALPLCKARPARFPLEASVVLCFFACFGIPISWPKLQMGRRITWIGWELNFSAGGFRLPRDKREKAVALLEACFSGRHVSKKHLDKVLGLMQWILQCAPELRPWLCCLYDDMRWPLGAACSIDPSDWSCLSAHLPDNLRLVSTPRGTSIPVGSTLLSARHTEIKCKTDLRLVPISSRRIWLRVADPASSRRKLSEPTREMLRFLLWWCKYPWPWRPALPPVLPFESVADAFGEGNACGVGGWLRVGSTHCFWFSERFTPADFRSLGIPVIQSKMMQTWTSHLMRRCWPKAFS